MKKCFLCSIDKSEYSFARFDDYPVAEGQVLIFYYRQELKYYYSRFGVHFS